MKYHFQIHKEIHGYWAHCIELPGCKTQADTLNELKLAMSEVLALYLDEPAESDVFFPLPDKDVSGLEIEEVAVAAELALPVLVRHYRLQKGLNMEEAKNQLKLKHRTDYARLEQRGNPTLRKIARIKEAWPDFPLELCFPQSA